jgi:hypothetical protein
MSGGIINIKEQLINCECGYEPSLFWHYITGVANKVNYFIKCKNCKIRTRNRKNIEGAIQDCVIL